MAAVTRLTDKANNHVLWLCTKVIDHLSCRSLAQDNHLLSANQADYLIAIRRELWRKRGTPGFPFTPRIFSYHLTATTTMVSPSDSLATGIKIDVVMISKMQVIRLDSISGKHIEQPRAGLRYVSTRSRNIKTLFNFQPPRKSAVTSR